MGINLHPCPFCGRSESLAIQEWKTGGVHEEPVLYAASCHGCACIGPDAKTPEEAAEKWNVRVSVTEIQTTDPFLPAAEELCERAIYRVSHAGGVRCAGCGQFLTVTAWGRIGQNPRRFPHRPACPAQWIGDLLQQVKP